MGKNCLHTINQVKNIYIRYCFHNAKNRQRLKNVLTGDFKPLFDIKGSLYIHGHTHCPPDLSKELGDIFNHILCTLNLDATDLTAIKGILKSVAFKNTLKSYEKSRKKLLSMIHSHHIDKIGWEATNEYVIGRKDNINSCYIIFEMLNKGLSSVKQASDLLLVTHGPVLFLYFLEKLEGIELIGVEGAAYLEAKKAVAEALENLETCPDKLAGYQEFCKAVFLNHNERNAEAAENIQKHVGKNILLVIGDGHIRREKHEGVPMIPIQDYMPKNWKVKTN